MNISVIKRDGTKEPFQTDKIERVVKAAGLSEEQTAQLVSNLNEWIGGLNVPEVSSLVIRDKVIEELKKLDSYAANMFSWYQKTKDTAQSDESTPKA